MKIFKTGLLAALVAGSWAAGAQVHEITYSLGTSTVQGEYAPSGGVSSAWDINFGIAYNLEPRDMRHWRFGGQAKFYRLNYQGTGSPENWKWGLDIEGQGVLGLVTMRYVLGPNVDYNAYTGMTLPYVELGAGAHFVQLRGVHDQVEAHQYSALGSYTLPAVHLALGTNVMLNHSLGLHLAAGGQWTNSDKMDGIVASGDADDIFTYAEIGITWMIPGR